MNLADALNLWVEVSGVDPSNKGGSTSMSNYDILKMHEGIKEALELDGTEDTGKLFLDYIVRDYFKDKSFSVESLLLDTDKVISYLDKSKRLLSYMNSDEVKGVSAHFRAKLNEAMTQYEFNNPELTSFINDEIGPAVLRRDAMKSIQRLRVNQFTQGEFSPPEVKPVYGKFLYRWWNINSMLQAMTAMPNGITLNAICNPIAMTQSYFCFCIKNGGNLFVFTDKEKVEHPLQEDMRRRPDKLIASRANRNWFPYNDIGLKYDEETKKHYMDSSDQTSIVPYQSEVDILKPISQLSVCEITWVTMMFDLIVDKFWKQKHQAPQLSYTGEMVNVGTALIDSAKKANLPVANYIPLKVEPIKVCDIYDENVDKSAMGRPGGNHNLWLELRYRHLVDDSIVNIIGMKDSHIGVDLKLASPDSKLSPVKIPEDGSTERFFNKERYFDLSVFDAASFGSEEDIRKDRLFIARKNFAKVIQHYATEEFNRTRQSIKQWLVDRIVSNTSNLLKNPQNELTFGQYLYDIKSPKFKESGYTYSLGWAPIGIYEGSYQEKKGSQPNCFFTGSVSSYILGFKPDTAEDLAFLCGCKVSEMPDVLQHWTRNRPMGNGNHILDRIDPVSWAIVNPWCSLHINVAVFLSKKAIKEIDVSRFKNLTE